MAAENGSPARDPTSSGFRGRGRGGRGGRGRGRGGGRGASSANVTKSTTTRGGRGGTRRGRAKNFQDSRVQAAYERQRDLKATYQAVAQALKPALQELAERNIDDLLQNPERHAEVEEHYPVIRQLQANYTNRLAEHDKRLECDLNLAESNYNHEQYVIEQEFNNGVEELLEQFYDGQENRLRILAALHSKDLPVDIRDDQYEYITITDDHFDNEFNLYEPMKDGHLVPYPSRVEGTDMWQKARDAEAEAAAAVAAAAASSASSGLSAAPTRGRGRGRGGIRRRLLEQPDGATTPKRSSRLAADDSQLLTNIPIAPAKGLLASAAEVEKAPEGTPGEEESASGTPEPSGFFSAMQARQQGRLGTREKSPPLPKHVAEPDEHGVRVYNQRPSVRDKILNSRIIAPQSVIFDDLDIGFRDSSNDSSKGHTRAKRGKYLDTPNSNGFHIDHWCNAFDYSSLTPKDFDAELVKRHRVHPKYGIFLPDSCNENPGTKPYNMPGKPIVFIANPSGRISHASRSFQKTVNYHRSVDAPWRQKFNASVRRFCKIDQIDTEEVSISEYVPTDEELRARSLGTAEKELETRLSSSEDTPMQEVDEVEYEEQASEQPEAERPDLSSLTNAAAFIEAEEAAEAAARATPAPPKPAKYDAVRDLFVAESEPAPVATTPKPEQAKLNLLAELCLSNPRNAIVSVEHDIKGPSSSVPTQSYLPPVEMQPPISSERENSYVPGTPIPSLREPRMMTAENMDRPSQPYSQPEQLAPPSILRQSDSLGDHRPYLPIQQPPNESPLYPPIQDHVATSQQVPPPMVPEYSSGHHYPPPSQDHGGYSSSHPGYPVPEYRDSPPIQRSYDPRMERRLSGYGAENSAYGRTYWSQQPPSGPPPPQTPPAVAQPPPPSQHYLPPPHPSTGHSRVPFSSHATAEPLPPLRPPRARNQSLQDESMVDPGLRPNPPSSSFSNFYSSGPSRQYHHGYPAPEAQPLPSFQSRPSDRLMPNPQQPPPGSGYLNSPPPPPSYGPPTTSPTFAPMQLGVPPLTHGSPDDGRMGLGGPFRHRSNGSISGSAADLNSKYRKLQPAPMPAHRSWSNKPELKTIPYDHKNSSGDAAALPNSGPTQIRGWNVNQHRRRPRSDRRDTMDVANDREDSR
ncbi:unnamed protein product [Clonostachys solani]|uniref:Uncharacterized protein n=1 Tax=Clonostachys solani TaxID=160281 RepID=A0A9N9YUZ3_9HYPO|nr:unnamed protein product [Clonostachys solani]